MTSFTEEYFDSINKYYILKEKYENHVKSKKKNTYLVITLFNKINKYYQVKL